MRRAAVVGISLGAAVAVALGVGAFTWMSTRPPSASDVVLSYFSALSAGDAEAALDTTTTPSADDTVLAYAAVSDRVADAQIVSSTEKADSTAVVVSFMLAGEEYESTLQLSTDGGQGWQIADATADVTITTTIGDSVGIGDLVVAAGSPVALLPGRYELDALPRALVVGSAMVDAAPGVDANVAVEASLAPAATEAAQVQLDVYADSCTKAASTVPENCGIRIPWAADLGSLTSLAFRVDAHPAVALSPDGSSFAATGGVLVATAVGTTRDGGTGTFTYRADDWALRGSVSFEGNEMVLSVG